MSALGQLTFPLAPSASHVVVDMSPAAESPRVYGAYKLSATGATKAWSLDDPKYHSYKGGDSAGYRRALHHGGHVYLLLVTKTAPNRIVVIKDGDGAVVSDQPVGIGGSWGQNFWLVDERLQFVTDAAHRGPAYQLLTLDPAGPKLMGTIWTPPHSGTSAYEVPLVRPDIERLALPAH